MATLRSMPGVCAVLASSEWPGITRTPSCFHFGSVIAQFLFTSLPALCRACKSLGLLCGAEQGLGLVDAFLLFRCGIGIRNDAGAGLDIHLPVFDERRSQH